MSDQDPENIRPQLAEDIAESKTPEQIAKETYDRGKIDGVKLAGSTAGHFLGNRFALTVGYLELLMSQTSDDRTKNFLQQALNGANEASKLLHRMMAVTKEDLVDKITDTKGAEYIDLGAIRTQDELEAEQNNQR